MVESQTQFGFVFALHPQLLLFPSTKRETKRRKLKANSFNDQDQIPRLIYNIPLSSLIQNTAPNEFDLTQRGKL